MKKFRCVPPTLCLAAKSRTKLDISPTNAAASGALIGWPTYQMGRLLPTPILGKVAPITVRSSERW